MVGYLQLAHNERNERGNSVARVLASLGREDQLDRAALSRLVASLSRFLEPGEALEAGAPAGFSFLGAVEQGGSHVIGSLWDELGIGRALGRASGGRRFQRSVERAVFAMVCHRCLEPGSKLACTRWAHTKVHLPGVPEVDKDDLYAAMDFLLANSERVQEAVFFSVANLLNTEVDVIFFDTTSTYFEIEHEDDDEDDPDRPEAGHRRFGHSKDHRPDRPQVVIGLAVTREGIPVRCWVWPGNTSDQTVVEQIKTDLGGWKLGRVLCVVDSGFSAEDNLRILQRTGGHYIAGMKLRSGTREAREALTRPGRYKTVRDNLDVKDITIGDGEARERYVVCRNPREAERDQARRDKAITRLETELADLHQQTGKAHHKKTCELRAHPTLGRYLRQTKTGKLAIDRAKITDEQRLDGKFLLRTSDDTLSAEDVALGYKNLLEAERAFHTLKGTLDLRPVYHRKEDRIRSHVLICFLALTIVRVCERRTDQTWPTIRDQLWHIQLGRFRSTDGDFEQRTELTAEQRALLANLGVPEPPRLGHITPTPATTSA